MQWLANWHLREGPGIPKDLPRKRGLALFAQIVGREAIELFKLNLLVILASLPLVTVFAAHAAGLRIADAMVRDENVYLTEDFAKALRELFWRATLAGSVLSAALGLSSYAVFVYAQIAWHDPRFAAPFAAASVVLVLLAVFAANVLALLAEGRGLRAVARPAFLATLAAPLPVVGALGFAAALWLVHVLFYPASVFMPVAFNVSLGLLAVAFATGASAARVPELAADRLGRGETREPHSINGVTDAAREEHACAR